MDIRWFKMPLKQKVHFWFIIAIQARFQTIEMMFSVYKAYLKRHSIHATRDSWFGLHIDGGDASQRLQGTSSVTAESQGWSKFHQWRMRTKKQKLSSRLPCCCC
jgi:hypothetical protein